MASKYENKYDSFDMSDADWSSSTISYGPAYTAGNAAGGSHWSIPICLTCQSSPCICNAVSSVQIGTVDTSIEDLIERLSICQVCGAEDSFVLCSVCVEAVKLARNKWLDEFRKEIDALVD